MSWYSEFRAAQEAEYKRWREENGYIEIPVLIQKYLGGYRHIHKDELKELKKLFKGI